MASRAYYSATLVAVRHLYILGRQLGLLNQSRPRGFDSETRRFRRVPSRRTSKRRIFSQFLVFRLGLRRKFGAWVSIRAKAEDHTVACCKRAPHSKVGHSERFYRQESAFWAAGQLSLHASQMGTSPCAKHVETLWDVGVDRIFRRTVCL